MSNVKYLQGAQRRHQALTTIDRELKRIEHISVTTGLKKEDCQRLEILLKSQKLAVETRSPADIEEVAMTDEELLAHMEKHKEEE